MTAGPISSDAADAHLDAILEAWNPSETGAEAVVSALLGRNIIRVEKCRSRQLIHAGQIPIFYNHPYNSSHGISPAASAF